MTFTDRLARNTTVSESGCLLWVSGMSKDGYVRVLIGSRTDPTREPELPHTTLEETTP